MLFGCNISLVNVVFITVLAIYMFVPHDTFAYIIQHNVTQSV